MKWWHGIKRANEKRENNMKVKDDWLRSVGVQRRNKLYIDVEEIEKGGVQRYLQLFLHWMFDWC
jgi:hypothetical protein